MKRAVPVIAIGAVLAVAAVLGFAHSPQREGQGKNVIFASSSQASFTAVVAGVSTSLIWGDTVQGPFGAFTRFDPGFDAPMHTHTNDVLLVILRGAYLYRDAAGEKRVGVGDFIRIPGGHKHWSGGDATQGALFYQEAFGKFDLVPAR